MISAVIALVTKMGESDSCLVGGLKSALPCLVSYPVLFPQQGVIRCCGQRALLSSDV
jgi:hypothetical protein